MKAKMVNEIQNFKRGEDPYNKLELGKFRPFEEDTKIKMLSDEEFWNENDILIYVHETGDYYAAFHQYQYKDKSILRSIFVDTPSNKNLDPGHWLRISWLKENPDKWERIEDI